MFSVIFPGSGQTKPGAQGKKLASKAKGKCSGNSDWLMVGQVFRQAAASVIRADCAFGVFYRRLKSRLGPAQSVVATAHKNLS